MLPTRVRVTHMEAQHHRDQLLAVVEQALAQVGRHIERLAMYSLVCVLWGVVLFAALGFPLP